MPVFTVFTVWQFALCCCKQCTKSSNKDQSVLLFGISLFLIVSFGYQLLSSVLLFLLPHHLHW